MWPRTISKTLMRCFASAVSDKASEEVTKLVAIEKFKQKAVRVSVLGVDNPSGEYLAFFLKQNPLVSHLFLVGEKAPGIAADLDSMDTRTMVSGYSENDIEKAVKRAEIIVMLGLERHRNQETTPETQFNREYERVIRLTRVCTMYAAKSLIYVCVNPISFMVPLVSAIFKKTHWYHPGRIIGSVAVHQVRLNALLGNYYQLDPAGINVPICGGPDLDSIVPLFSRATPIGTSDHDGELLTKRFKGLKDTDNILKEVRSTKYDAYAMPKAYAINRSVTSLAFGLLGDHTNTVGHIRSNIFQTCSYLTSTLQVGHGGVIHNYGIPLLTRTELLLLEKALLTLREREEQVLSVVGGIDEKKIALMAG